MNEQAVDSVEQVLREELTRGDAILASARPILRHLLANDDHALFSDEMIARIRGMATRQPPLIPFEDEPADAALRQRPWRMDARLSSVGDAADAALAKAGFDRGPWLAIAFAGGIAAWFVLDDPAQWIGFAGLCLLVAVGAVALWRGNDRRGQVLTAVVAIGLLAAAGLGIAWARSAMAGAEPLGRPASARLEGRVLERIEQPAEGRIRLVLATREPGGDRAIKVRVNVPLEKDRPALAEGALVRLQARLMPPSPPMLPGSYDFARSAWFEGQAATGSVQGEIELLEPGTGRAALPELQRRLSEHEHRLRIGRRHVVDRQQRDRGGGQCFHFDSGPAGQRGAGGGAHAVCLEGEIDRDRVEGERVAQRDQLAGLLGGHDPGDPRRGEDVALGPAAVAHRGERFGGHADLAGRGRRARRLRLAANVDHPRRALVVEMRELAHPRAHARSRGPRHRLRVLLHHTCKMPSATAIAP